MKLIGAFLLCFFLATPIAAAGAAQSPTIPKGIPKDSQEAEVVSYVDGEKIKAKIEGEEREVRMIGIDAPELKGGNDQPECFTKESLANLEKLIPVGSTVYLEKDVGDKDGKGRLWRYIWIEGVTTIRGNLLNETLVKTGYAIDQDEDKNTKYDKQIAKAEKDAKSKDRGLWGQCGGGHIESTPIPEYGSKEDPGQVGETFEAESLEVTLSDAYYTDEYNYSTPKGGYVFLILEVELRNQGQDEKNYRSDRFTALDVETDAKYEETFVLLDQPLDGGELSTSEFVSGQVAIEVQDTSTGVRVQYQISDFGDNFVNWLVPR